MDLDLFFEVLCIFAFLAGIFFLWLGRRCMADATRSLERANAVLAEAITERMTAQRLVAALREGAAHAQREGLHS